MSIEADLEDRALAAWIKRRLLPKLAARPLLAATESLTLACLASLNRLREHRERTPSHREQAPQARSDTDLFHRRDVSAA